MKKSNITVWITALIMVVSMAGQSAVAFGADDGATALTPGWNHTIQKAATECGSDSKVVAGKTDKTGFSFVKSKAKSSSSKTVYITKTGKKFHKKSCRHLSKSKIAIKKAKAVARGYKPCKICRP